MPIRPFVDVQPDDAALVGRALGGDKWAESELFRRHASRLLGLLRRMLHSVADAEDAAQDTFVVAFKDLAKLQNPAAFGGWLTGIAVHKAHRLYNKRRLLRVLGISPQLDATFENIADPGLSPEKRVELSFMQKALGKLSIDERTAWMLRKVEGYELADIASTLDVSLATVKRRISAAEELVAKIAKREVQR